MVRAKKSPPPLHHAIPLRSNSIVSFYKEIQNNCLYMPRSKKYRFHLFFIMSSSLSVSIDLKWKTLMAFVDAHRWCKIVDGGFKKKFGRVGRGTAYTCVKSVCLGQLRFKVGYGWNRCDKKWRHVSDFIWPFFFSPLCLCMRWKNAEPLFVIFFFHLKRRNNKSHFCVFVRVCVCGGYICNNTIVVSIHCVFWKNFYLKLTLSSKMTY